MFFTYVLSSKVNYPSISTIHHAHIDLKAAKPSQAQTAHNDSGESRSQTYLNSDGVANSHGAALLPVCYITFSVG